MVLKCVVRDPGNARTASAYFEPVPPVFTGRHYFDDGPFGRPYANALGLDLDSPVIHVFGIEEEPDIKRTEQPSSWIVKFAHWVGPDGIELVVTSGDIYLLSDQGDTIDKVR